MRIEFLDIFPFDIANGWFTEGVEFLDIDIGG
jgi:hypothetical protein